MLQHQATKLLSAPTVRAPRALGLLLTPLSLFLCRLLPLPRSPRYAEPVFKKMLFIYWLCWVFVAVSGLSLAESRGGCSLVAVRRFLMQWLLLLQSMGSRHVGFSSCSARAQYLWCTGLVAPLHVGSSQTRD